MNKSGCKTANCVNKKAIVCASSHLVIQTRPHRFFKTAIPYNYEKSCNYLSTKSKLSTRVQVPLKRLYLRSKVVLPGRVLDNAAFGVHILA